MSKINSVEMLEAIRPPKGFNLYSLVVCSYTFDPDLGLALLSHVSDDSLESHAVLEDVPGNREKIRQLLLNNLPNSLFICDGHGPFTGKSEISGVRCIFLDQVVKKTRHTNELGSFHPKIILATYFDEQKNYCGRLYIGSKNLSRNTMQEYGVVINLIQQKRKTEFNKELLLILSDLGNNEITESAKARNNVIEKTIKLLEKCNLTAEDSNVRLFWQSRWGGGLSLYQQLDYILKKTWTEVYVHSLWVREAAVEWLNQDLKEACIRIKCLRQKGFNYPILPNAGGYQFEVESINQNDRHRWHQKIILFRNSTIDFLIFGSANFTTRGLGFNRKRNSEIMISFEKKQGEFRYLDIKGNIEQGQDLSSSEILIDPNEFIYDLLNQIEIRTEYLKSKRTLRYLIQHEWNSMREMGTKFLFFQANICQMKSSIQ